MTLASKTLVPLRELCQRFTTRQHPKILPYYPLCSIALLDSIGVGFGMDFKLLLQSMHAIESATGGFGILALATLKSCNPSTRVYPALDHGREWSSVAGP
jgi:hypothetical protein